MSGNDFFARAECHGYPTDCRGFLGCPGARSGQTLPISAIYARCDSGVDPLGRNWDYGIRAEEIRTNPERLPLPPRSGLRPGRKFFRSERDG